MALVPEEVVLARIRRENAARLDADAALRAALVEAEGRLANQISLLSKKVTGVVDGRSVNASAIAGLIQRVQVEPGFALAEQLTTLEARVDDNVASYTEQITALVDSAHAEATKVEILRARFSGSEARIEVIESTYATKSFAESKKTEAITAAAADATAKVLTESTARAAADAATASTISTLSAAVAGNTAAISDEATARATADSATASTIATLSATVSGNTASISAEATARATADGNLSGKYTLKVIAGNIVTGMNITSSTGGGTDTSEVTFQASSFKIYNGSSAGVPVFTASGGVVQMANAVVTGTLDIGGAYSRSRIDSSGIVFGYGQTQRVAFEYNGSSSALNHYAGNHNVSTLYAATTGGVADTAALQLTSYVSGIITNVTTLAGGGLSSTSSLSLSAPSGVTITGALFPNNGIQVTGSTIINAGGLQVAHQIILGGGASYPLTASSGRLYFSAGGLNRWSISDSTGNLISEGGSILTASGSGYTIPLVAGSDSIELKYSGGHFYIRANGGADQFLV